MEKYLFKNWKTFPFKKKSFDGQLDRYLTVCVVNAESPQTVLDIIPIYGSEKHSDFREIIKLIYDIERGIEINESSRELFESLQKPIWGQFEEIKSQHGPLFHQFTPAEARYGLCSECDVWKPERDENGKVIEFMSIKVFTHSIYHPDFRKYGYANGWFPHQMYYKYFGFRYRPISLLREPMKL